LVAASKMGILSEPILVGREKELAELQSHLNLAIKGKGRTVFVSGEAGAGKTRLITEFIGSARKEGVAVLTGWCLSNAAVPYFPFFEAFSQYFICDGSEKLEGTPEKLDGSQSVGSEVKKNELQSLDLVDWLKSPGHSGKVENTPAISPQAWKDQTFAAVARTISAISSLKPVILFIDDVHWADSASLALIHYLARTIASEKVLVLLTFRNEELTFDVEGRPSPLIETIRLMRRENLFSEIKLTLLNQESVCALTRNMLGGNLQPVLAEKLSEESQGNPLFVVESVKMLREQEGIVKEEDFWRMTHDKIEIPEKIRDIILQRLHVLTRNQRKVLDVASVIGERFDAGILASVLGLELSEVLEILDIIGQATGVVRCAQDFYKIDHSRSREAIYGEISPVLRKMYHGKVAERLEKMRKSGDLLASDLAYHFVEAGNTDKAVKYSLAAGREALARWSNEEAIEHFSFVIKTANESTMYQEEMSSAMEGLGEAYYANSMFDQSINVFDELANETKDGYLKLRVLRKGIESAFQFGNASKLMEFIKKAEPYASMDRLESARILHAKARAFTMVGKTSAAHQFCIDAMKVLEEEYSMWDVAFADISLGLSYTIQGSPKQGLFHCLRSIAIFRELGDFRNEMEAYWVAGIAFRNSALYLESIKLYSKVAEINDNLKLGDFYRLVQTNTWMAHSYEELGLFDEALRCSKIALSFSQDTDSLWAREMLYGNLVREYSILDRVDSAERFFNEWAKLPAALIGHPFGIATRAVFYAAKDKWDEAETNFRLLFDEASKNCTNYDVLVVANQLYAWALERRKRVDQAMALREEYSRIKQRVEAEFEHADLQAHLMVRRQVIVNEEFEIRVDLVNVAQTLGHLVRVEGIFPSDCFVVTALPSCCDLHKGFLSLKDKVICPFKIETVKLKLKAAKPGSYTLNPIAVYIDDLNKTKTYQLKSITLTVKAPKPAFEALPGRLTTDTIELDKLLLGGIPEGYAVALISPPFEERQRIISNYVEAGPKNSQTTFYLTTELENAKTLAEKYQSSLYLFICNPRAGLPVKDLSNIFILAGVDNLTSIDIAVEKAYRQLPSNNKGSSRVCIEIVSDALLQHHAVNTRKWLMGLIATLKSKGFTILATIDPSMHSPDEVSAVLGLFDGEIRIIEKEDEQGERKGIQVRKLQRQKYLQNEAVLTKE
jgi:tetratricopeptide (TPR) repeat protein